MTPSTRRRFLYSAVAAAAALAAAPHAALAVKGGAKKPKKPKGGDGDGGGGGGGKKAEKKRDKRTEEFTLSEDSALRLNADVKLKRSSGQLRIRLVRIDANTGRSDTVIWWGPYSADMTGATKPIAVAPGEYELEYTGGGVSFTAEAQARPAKDAQSAYRTVATLRGDMA